MNTLEIYLDKIQKEEQLQEVDPLTAGGIALGAGTLMVLLNLIRLLSGISDLKKSLKVHKGLSKELNDILNSGNKWSVQIVPDISPNAFAAGGTYVFITSGLLKILNKREQMAVLLHEVYHNKKKHLAKKLAYEYSLYYLLIYIISLLTPGIHLFFLALFAFQISLAILKIPYAITVGRRKEYNADAYSIRFGYADDEISALKKIETELAKMSRGQKCGVICQLVNKISHAINEHPSIQKRVERILRKKEAAVAAGRGNMSRLKKVVYAAAGISR